MGGIQVGKRHLRLAVADFCFRPVAALSPRSRCSRPSIRRLRNSTSVRIAAADVQRAAAGVSEARDVYVPNFVLGSSVGYTYGFPIGQPTIVNVSTQSLLFTFSQRDYIRSARAALKAAQLTLADARQQVVFDAALDYVQLDTDRRRIEVLDDQNGDASRLTAIEQQRLDAGVGTREDVLRAKLLSAQIRLKRLHIQDDIDVVRERLAHLTGLPADTLETETRSIPPSPDLERDNPSTGIVASLTAMNTEGVRAAYANAQSHQYQAFGDARQIYRPQIGFGSTYSRFSEINNYQEYYLRFQHNNFEAGLQITLPLFDASRRAKERESVAEAARATAQADQARDQSSENIVTAAEEPQRTRRTKGSGAAAERTCAEPAGRNFDPDQFAQHRTRCNAADSTGRTTGPHRGTSSCRRPARRRLRIDEGRTRTASRYRRD